LTITKKELDARLGRVERRVDLAQATAREAIDTARQTNANANASAAIRTATEIIQKQEQEISDRAYYGHYTFDPRSSGGEALYQAQREIKYLQVDNRILRDTLRRSNEIASRLSYYVPPAAAPTPPAPKRGPAHTWQGRQVPYHPGDVCFYEGRLYRFNNDRPGTTSQPHSSAWWTLLVDSPAPAKSPKEIIREAIDKL
jgi:hypothetical protein